MGVTVVSDELCLLDLDEGSEEWVKDEEAIKVASLNRGTPEVNYEALYANANQIARDLRVGSVPCGELLSVNGRMFVRLDSLDVSRLQQPERVQNLVVLADVVEISGRDLALPGTSSVRIVCRVLHLRSRDVQLDLPYAWGTSAQSQPFQFSLRAQQIVVSPSAVPPSLSSNGALVVRLHRELNQWATTRTSFTQYAVRCFGYTASSVNSTVNINIPVSAETPPSFHWLRVDSENLHLKVSQTAVWRAHVNVQVALPSQDDLNDVQIVTGMESTLLTAEMILSYRSDRPEVVALAQEHVEWIRVSLVQNREQQSNLHDHKFALLARAEMLAKLPVDGSQSLVVPQLEYTAYNEVIRQIADVAEAYNQEFTQLHLFVQQTTILGDYILNTVKALAEKERDIALLEEAIVRGKQSELDIAVEKIERLEQQILKQLEEVQEAKEDMEKGIIAYRNRLIANAFFEVLSAILQIAGSFVYFKTGQISDGLASLGGGLASANQAIWLIVDAVDAKNSLSNITDNLVDVEKAMEVVNAVLALVDTVTNLDELLDAPRMPDVDSSHWDIMENEIEVVAAQMPTEVSEVRVWSLKCRNVVIVCREACTTAAAIMQLQYELFVHARKKEISERHAERLAQIQAVDLGDYLELASQADMRTVRLLIQLLDLLATQNGALQYHYLLPPEPFVGWPTIDTVRRMLVARQQQAVISQTNLGPSYRVRTRLVLDSVPVGLLLSGEDYSFTIAPINEQSIPVFPAVWSRVRIEELQMVFTAGTAGAHMPVAGPGGKVYLLLQPSSTFHDRLRYQVFNYEAAGPRPFQYAYDLATGEPSLVSRPSEQGLFLRMTPFTRWRLRLSASAYQNEGISFPTATAADSVAELTITFELTAIVHPQSFIEEDGITFLMPGKGGDEVVS